MVQLSIIIVNYNVTTLLRKCLESIEKFVENVDYEIIVIDNNSTDNSWKMLKKEFPNVSFMESDSNLGFSKANNRAIQNSKGKYLLLLNPDTELEEKGLNNLLSFAESVPNFGSLGVRMHNADGFFLPESKRSIPNMYNSFEKLFTNIKNNNSKSYYRNDIQENEIAEVEILTGAFLLCKREIYMQLGGLDERYFMYGEDIDLCYTFLQNGYSNWYYGAYSILHHKGESTEKNKQYLDRFYGAMQLFIEKYYLHKNPAQYYFLKAGLNLRYRLEILKFKRQKR